MRLSANPDSPYYDEASARSSVVFLNEEPLRLAVEACEEEGWADVLETDDTGTPIISGGEFQHRRVHGSVKISRNAI